MLNELSHKHYSIVCRGGRCVAQQVEQMDSQSKGCGFLASHLQLRLSIQVINGEVLKWMLQFKYYCICNGCLPN